MDLNSFYQGNSCPNCGSRDIGSIKISDIVNAGVCNSCQGIPAYCSIHNVPHTIENTNLRNDCPICNEKNIDGMTHAFWIR